MSRDLLAIRFIGPELNSRSLPIYELGTALVAIQRIIQKSSLYAEGRLEKGAHLDSEERERLALQIVDHRKGSDLWSLAPYLTNPAYGPILQGLVVAGFGALTAYAWKKVLTDKKPPPNQVLIVNIYPEVKSLTDRIGNIGGVEAIELSSPMNSRVDPINLTVDVQKYVREVEHGRVLGEKTRITGYITRLYPQSFRLDLICLSCCFPALASLPGLSPWPWSSPRSGCRWRWCSGSDFFLRLCWWHRLSGPRLDSGR
jgi:hypothetical protein